MHPPYHLKQESTEMAPKELWKRLDLQMNEALLLCTISNELVYGGGKDKWTLRAPFGNTINDIHDHPGAKQLGGDQVSCQQFLNKNTVF